ncbi:MAG: hypothetical protein L0H59_19265 [Tomitella sp.]|nr:hypothetical protein [Tomitella sp.]
MHTNTAPSPATSPLTEALGLRLGILRNTTFPDCSNHGISAAADNVVLAGIYDPDSKSLTAVPKSLRVSPANSKAPAVVLTWHPTGTRDFLTLRGRQGGFFLIPDTLLEPVEGRPVKYQRRHSMFGGTFGWTGDSRLVDAVNELAGGPFPVAPLMLHDRVE